MICSGGKSVRVEREEYERRDEFSVGDLVRDDREGFSTWLNSSRLVDL